MTDVKVKLPPVSVEAEESVLGACLIDPSALDKIVDQISPDDFHLKRHRVIYQAILNQAKSSEQFDVLTVSEHLKNRQLLDVSGGDDYIMRLANQTPSAAHIEQYAAIVRDRSILRSLLAYATDITEKAYTPGDKNANDVLESAEAGLFKLSQSSSQANGPEKMNTIIDRTAGMIDQLANNKVGVSGHPTGFSDFDKLTSGLQNSDMIVVAARPSMGKTVLSCNFAENVLVSEGKPVLIFSLELPSEQIAMRMLSSLGRIDQHRIRSGNLQDDDWPRLSAAMKMLEDSPLYIDDTPGISPAEIRSRARQLKRRDPDLGLIVVDYLQLIRVPGKNENRTQEIAEISRSLKLIAKELNVPVVAVSQLNRSLEQRNDKRPMMSDLRESGAIEQDADLICFIYRDEVYNPESPDKGTAEVIIAKHRNGPIGRVRLAFLGQFTRFENHAVGEMAYE